MVMLATAEELRSFLTLDEIDETRANLLIESISSEVLKFTDQRFDAQVTETIYLDGSGTKVILMPGLPVYAVGSVTEGGTALTVHDDFEWSADGILRRVSGCWAQKFRNVAVNYTHGFVAVPAEVRLLVLRVAARGFVNPTATTNESMGGYSAGYGFDATRQAALSEADRDMLRDYMGR
jgi:hypothetical protein